MTKIATGFIGGTVLGMTLGLLFAPKKGAKTRALIAAAAKNLSPTPAKTYEGTLDDQSHKK